MKKAVRPPFNTYDDHVYVLDIETTTDWDSIRLVGLYDQDARSHNVHMIYPEDLEARLKVLNKEQATIITWNGTRFDWWLLDKLWDIRKSDYPDIRHIDGMLLAKLLMPNQPSYSLDNIGKKLGCHITKTEVDYDKAPLSELAAYLKNDLSLTMEVVQRMMSQYKPTHPRAVQRALDLETKVATLCQQQVDIGVCFDMDAAEILRSNLQAQMQMIEDDIHPHLPEWPLPPSKLHQPPTLQFKADGTPSAHIVNYCTKYGWEIEYDVAHRTHLAAKKGERPRKLPLTAPLVTTEKLQLSNQAAIKAWLQTEGWVPTIWNTKRDPKTGKYVQTSPRLTDKQTKEPCPNLKAMGTTWASDISDWLTLRSRKNVIFSSNGTGWIANARKESATIYTLPSDADTMGANTARWTHKVIANVPRVKSAYGKQMRELFCARPEKWWVGWDASSLEACMEAHYVNPYDPSAAEELMDGDPHTKNLHAIAPLKDRDHAKTLKYGITYGAQPPKVASILGVPKSEGQMWFDKFWHANPALAKLREDTIREARGGSIIALDGRDIGIRSEHSCLNAKFQSAGAIVMKYAMVLADKMIHDKFGDEAYGLIRYHDEEIWECDTYEIAEEVGRLGCESIRMAGKLLKLNVNLDAEFKVGRNWAEVH